MKFKPCIIKVGVFLSLYLSTYGTAFAQILNELRSKRANKEWVFDKTDTLYRLSLIIDNLTEKDSFPVFLESVCFELEYASFRQSTHSYESLRKKVFSYLTNTKSIQLLLSKFGYKLNGICDKNNLLSPNIPDLDKSFYILLSRRLIELTTEKPLFVVCPKTPLCKVSVLSHLR